MTKGCLGGLIGSPGNPGEEHEPQSEEGGDVVAVGPRIRPSELKPERCGPEEVAEVTISYSIAILLLLLLLSFVCGDAVVSSISLSTMMVAA